MSGKQRLELTWIGKENRPRLEPRILLEDPEKSYHAKRRVTDNDIFDNRLIFGDNLLALKALEQEFAGKIKCVFIDPPYNTGSAFTHYDDGIEHSIWLSLMRDRLEIDSESACSLMTARSGYQLTKMNRAPYLKSSLRRDIWRNQFRSNCRMWRETHILTSGKQLGVASSDAHEYVLVLRKESPEFQIWRQKETYFR